jgi:hypothetical protein
MKILIFVVVLFTTVAVSQERNPYDQLGSPTRMQENVCLFGQVKCQFWNFRLSVDAALWDHIQRNN